MEMVDGLMVMVNCQWRWLTVDGDGRLSMATVNCRWRRSMVTVTTTVDGDGNGW